MFLVREIKVLNIESILCKYYGIQNATIKTGESGVNNTTRYVYSGDQRYVIRIYETHKDINKVEF